VPPASHSERDELGTRLRRHVYQLADAIGERNVFHPDALHASEAYIQGCWQDLGYRVKRDEYRVREVPSANLEISLPGQSAAAEILLLGAHYDSVQGSPGANDNGSGVAVLLELSRLLREARPARTLRLVAFVNEEPPFFFTRQQGSMRYARAARRRGDDIRLMLSLETLGYYCEASGCQHYPPLLRWFYPSRGNFLALVSNLRSRRQLRRLTRAFRNHSTFPVERLATFAWVPGVAWSDHLAFWMQRYRAVMVTDTAFYRYPYYHSAEDTAEKLDYERLALVTEGLAGAILELAGQGV
jgi:Zn-dependent M28 family amino/carboxypeptidase